jgi:hypothetical protein
MSDSEAIRHSADDLLPHLAQYVRLTWRHVGVCAFFGLLFLVLTHRPPNALDSAEVSWLGLSTLTIAHATGGGLAVAGVLGVTSWLALTLFGWSVYAQSRNTAIALGAVSAAFATGLWFLPPRGIEAFGLLFLAGLMLLCAYSNRTAVDQTAANSRFLWRGMASCLASGALTYLWAAFHPSAVWGLVLLIGVAVFPLAETMFRTEKWTMAFADNQIRFGLFALVGGVLGLVLGSGTLSHVSAIGLLRWGVPILMFGLAALAGSWQKVTVSDDQPKTTGQKVESTERSPMDFVPTLVCGLIVWCSFVLSPLANPFFGRGRQVNTQSPSKASAGQQVSQSGIGGTN